MKRFTETTKWGDSWFSDLPLNYKVGWLYCLDACDCAGFLELNGRILSFNIGETIDVDEFLAAMDHRIVRIANGKYFIPRFIAFQYVKGLTDTNKAHVGVLRRLKDNEVHYPFNARSFEGCYKGASKGLRSTCQGVQEQEQETEHVKDKESDKEQVKATVQVKEQEEEDRPF